jgi:polyhydroxybutyrate depolymerase
MLRTPIDYKPPRKNRRFTGTVLMLFSFAGTLLIIVALQLVAIFHAHSSSKLLFVSSTSNTPGPAQLVNTCQAPPHTAGDSNVSITSGGLKRTFLIHLAPSYGTQPQPLVINYHGYSNTAQHFAQYTNMGAEADKAGFIVVFPQGVDDPPSWNAGIGALGPTGDADDVQFTRDLLSYVEKNYCVDTHRVYVTGYSLGGGMAYRIACTLTNQITAIATVAGAFYPAPGGCHPSRPLPVLEIHGVADRFAPYNGNPTIGMAAVQTYLNVWLNEDSCGNTTKVVFQQNDVTATAWMNCTSGTAVIHYRISDGGHTWPGAGPIPALGLTTHTIDANEIIWNFFSQYKS